MSGTIKVRITLYFPIYKGQTPLDIAFHVSTASTVQTLIKAGAPLNSVTLAHHVVKRQRDEDLGHNEFDQSSVLINMLQENGYPLNLLDSKGNITKSLYKI